MDIFNKSKKNGYREYVYTYCFTRYYSLNNNGLFLLPVTSENDTYNESIVCNLEWIHLHEKYDNIKKVNI